MKNQSLRVLIVEDSEDDALLVIRTLKKGGYNPVYERVETAAAMKKALKEKQWDIILCDYKLPQFSGPSAIASLKETNIDIPLIIVSGAMGEEAAIACMRLGAHDYIMKSNLSRLCPAIDRELKELEIRNKQMQMESQRKAAIEALRESEERYRALVENAKDVVFRTDINGHFTFANPAMLNVTGYSEEEIYKKHYRTLVRPDKYKETMKVLVGQYENREQNTYCEFPVIKKDGSEAWMGQNTQLIIDGDQVIGFQAVARDITERKQVEDALLQEKLFTEAVVDSMPGLFYLLDEKGKFLRWNKNWETVTGYSSQEMTLLIALDVIAKEDRELIARKISEVFQNGYAFVEGCLLTKTGEKIPYHFNGVRTVLGNKTYLVGMGIDIAERKQTEEKLLQTLDSLRKAFGTTIKVMVSAVEMRDPYTSGHQMRSADIARSIATEMGLSPDQIDGIRLAGSIHDIGKLSIPAEILSKPTKLTDLEFSLIKEHPQIGYEMLKDVESPWPLAQIVYQHHERMNGTGYPRNLKGDEIILEARIMAVADVVEAMASHRPYRPGLGIEAALEEIEKNKGILYDATVADACLRLFREKNFHIR